jgi:site-specific DNA-methyltransferase (adenine-specific)
MKTLNNLTPARMKAHYSSVTNEWVTPQPVFDQLNEEFKFTLDPCCTRESAKCSKYYTAKEDGLSKDWSSDRVFMNPPYGRVIGSWMRKAYEESQRGALVVCLVPARTDTAWWHDYAATGEVRFIRGRLNFVGDRARGHNAPFPVAIVILRPDVPRDMGKPCRHYDVKMVGRKCIHCGHEFFACPICCPVDNTCGDLKCAGRANAALCDGTVEHQPTPEAKNL